MTAHDNPMEMVRAVLKGGVRKDPGVIFENGTSASDLWSKAAHLSNLAKVGMMAADSSVAVRDPMNALESLFVVMWDIADELAERIGTVEALAEKNSGETKGPEEVS